LRQLETDVARLREDVEQLRAELTAMKSGAAMKTEESGQD
jgi:outer membrane murein-binding lipoprotein Lpp